MMELDDDDEGDNMTSDMESILGLMTAQGAPQRMLMWHYRSRHESLIMTSNYEFYNGRLKVFPSPNDNGGDSNLGLSYKHMSNAYYERGKSRTNPKEAQAVAEAVLDHARMFPQLTLGVATFSIAQMQAILDRLELLRREHPETEPFFSSHPEEPFFVKNLESVQGDERDVILISVGYGRTVDGYISMNFGALNNSGGERRLNVLISRARRRCVVYSNLSHSDIDLNRTQSRGVLAFKRFLQFAETGELDMPILTGGGSDSLFEEEVARGLQSLGYDVKQQVGSAGFFIDMAIVDPIKPGRFLLGIECDGASYHSSRTARDRDRLRQQVLEGLGWQIYRIWSTDWFNNPDEELRKVVGEIERAKTKTRETSNPGSLNNRVVEAKAALERTAETKDEAKPKNSLYREASFPIVYYGFDFHEMSYPDFERFLTEIIKIEGPIHKDLLFRRITELADINRIGNRISGVLNDVLDLMKSQQTVKSSGDFIWVPRSNLSQVRSREEFPATFKKIKYIYSKEIEAAIKASIQGTFGINIDAIPPLAANLLGFSNTTSDIRSTIESITRNMLKRGVLTDKDVTVSG